MVFHRNIKERFRIQGQNWKIGKHPENGHEMNKTNLPNKSARKGPMKTVDVTLIIQKISISKFFTIYHKFEGEVSTIIENH